ncbi:MAG TPA: hypothetical protein VHU19_05160 [Pyrinomonadaceae bacterium]|jgi:hypothetical protein|nr:hypothetical protein [Pyrinomonadaceae bacterium]
MNTKRLISIIITWIAILFFASVVVFAATTTLVVFPGNLQGWQTQVSPGSQPTPASTPSVTFVFGPTPPPLGRGSAQLSVGSDGDAAAQLRQPGYAGTALPDPDPSASPAGNDLTVLTYSTYAQSGGSGGQAPYILLNIDNDNDGVADDFLFFEPVYQNGTYSTIFPGDTVPNQCGANPACVVTGQWQTWNALSGGWWSNNESAGGPPLITLRRYRQEHPNARIVNSSTGDGGVRIVVGFGAGSWDNFVGNVDNFRIGVGADLDTGDPNVTVYDFEPNVPPTPASHGVIISEFRNSGPGASGCASPTSAGIACSGPSAPVGSGGDEYVELYNTSNNDMTVTSEDGSGGWSLVKSSSTCADPPVVVATIPDGTVIPARGHYLLAGAGYSLSAYRAGDGSSQSPQTTATPDQTYAGTIGGDVNVGLFNTLDSTFFDPTHRLDAVGFNSGSGDTCALLSEGTPLPPTRGSTSQYAFVRKESFGGGVQNTDDNAADFIEVSTTPQTAVGDNASPILGAPGPQNTSSPVNRDDVIASGLTAPAVAQSLPPNRERRFGVEQCSPLGTLLIRRSFTNNSGSFVSRLRFRVMIITTVNSPDAGGGPQAILHARSSNGETVVAPGRTGTVQAHGLNAEQPPNQDINQCGGLNTSLSDDTITLSSPLAPGATVDEVFLLGIERSGFFRFYVNIEALESSAPAPSGPTGSSPTVRSKTPVAVTATTPGKSSPGKTPVVTPVSPFATPGVTPPATTPAMPGWRRKVSPDEWPDEAPDAMPVSKRTQHNNR